MKKILSLLLCGFMAMSLTACGETATQGTQGSSENRSERSEPSAPSAESTGNSENNDSQISSDNSQESSATPENSTDTTADSNILVAVFSLADEQYEVGIIEKGNTQIVAEIIAEQTGADMFMIEATEKYPTTYNGLLDISRKEENDPPKIAGTVSNMSDYDTVFIGYPIWWGDLPTIVKVFLESYDFSGKTVIPFCTHAGSGLSGTKKTVESLCGGATVKDGLAIRGSTAQNDYNAAEKTVTDWLDSLGFG